MQIYKDEINQQPTYITAVRLKEEARRSSNSELVGRNELTNIHHLLREIKSHSTRGFTPSPTANNMEDFEGLCERLEQNDPEVSILSFFGSRMVVGDAKAKRLANSLANNTTVTEIYLPVLHLTVKGAAYLMPFLISSPSLQIASLFGSLDTFEYPNQTMVVDVLIRAVICNYGHPCLEIGSCPVARSSLMAAVGASSLLSELCLVISSTLVVDNEDPVLDAMTFSCTLEAVSLMGGDALDPEDDDDDDEDAEEKRKMADWLFRCVVHLPKLERLVLVNCCGGGCCQEESFSLLLAKARRLRHVNFRIERYEGEEEEENASVIRQLCQPFFNFLRATDLLDKVSIHIELSANDQSMERDLVQALAHNHSITSISFGVHPRDTATALLEIGSRNRLFLEHWENLSSEVPDSVFALAAATAVKTQRGRTALVQRLAPLLSSREQNVEHEQTE
jgi:hypothetical protein